MVITGSLNVGGTVSIFTKEDGGTGTDGWKFTNDANTISGKTIKASAEKDLVL